MAGRGRRKRPSSPKKALGPTNVKNVTGGGILLPSSSLGKPVVAGFADRLAILDRGAYLELIFWSGDPLAPTGVYPIVVMIDDIIKALWESSQAFFQNLSRVWPNGSVPNLDVDAPGFSGAERFLVNMFRLSRSGLDALFECYYLSPFDVAWFNRQGRVGKLVPAPMFGVQMPATLIVKLLYEIEERIPQLRERLANYPTGAVSGL
jgi:hypothetical protein